MIRKDFCIINENIPRRHRGTNTQFLKHIIHEAEKSKAIRAHEILMASENPMIKEQKQTDQICSELKKVEQDKFLEQKRKVLLHQNDDEIRELNAQIKRANLHRQLVEQKAFNEQKIKETLQARTEEKKNFALECKRNMEKALKDEMESSQKKVAFRRELLQQMQEKAKQRELEREIVSEERASRQKYLQNIEKDIEYERQQALELKEMLRQDRDEYLQNVKIYKSKMQIHAQDDHRKYLEIMRQRDEDKILRKQKREKSLQDRAAVSERIGQQVLTLQLEKQQRSDVLLELLMEERLAKDDKRYKMDLEKQMQRAKSLHDDFQRSFEGRQQEMVLKRTEEKQMAQEQLKSLQIEQLKERDTTILKKQKNQYRQDLLNFIESKKLQRELDASNNKTQLQKELAEQKKRQQEIEAEKLRLLKAVPLENLKFLPVKALSQEHRAALGLTCKEIKDKNI